MLSFTGVFFPENSSWVFGKEDVKNGSLLWTMTYESLQADRQHLCSSLVPLKRTCPGNGEHLPRQREVWRSENNHFLRGESNVTGALMDGLHDLHTVITCYSRITY